MPARTPSSASLDNFEVPRIFVYLFQKGKNYRNQIKVAYVNLRKNFEKI